MAFVTLKYHVYIIIHVFIAQLKPAYRYNINLLFR